MLPGKPPKTKNYSAGSTDFMTATAQFDLTRHHRQGDSDLALQEIHHAEHQGQVKSTFRNVSFYTSSVNEETR